VRLLDGRGSAGRFLRRPQALLCDCFATAGLRIICALRFLKAVPRPRPSQAAAMPSLQTSAAVFVQALRKSRIR